MLKPGCRLVVFSDGIFDYPGNSREKLGISSIVELLEETRNVPFENIGEWVFGLLDSVNHRELPRGDQTVLVLEILSPPGGSN